MRRILTPSALAAFAVVAGLEAAPASAQQQPMVYAPPVPAAAYSQRVDNRGVMPAFAPQGGVGTTPYLGTTRGPVAYSASYGAAPRAMTTTTYPARRRGLFRRLFNR